MSLIKYERLYDVRVGTHAKQGSFVYAPLAQQDRAGVVKGSESIVVGIDGSITYNNVRTSPNGTHFRINMKVGDDGSVILEAVPIV